MRYSIASLAIASPHCAKLEGKIVTLTVAVMSSNVKNALPLQWFAVGTDHIANSFDNIVQIVIAQSAL